MLVGTLLVLLLIGRCTPAEINPKNYDPKIVGGSTVNSIEEAPHQVSLQLRNGFHFCGGSIIDKCWILTAAHCTDVLDPVNMTAVVGTTKLGLTEGKRFDIDRVIKHPNWNTMLIWNDLALIKVKCDEGLVGNGLPTQIIALPTTDTPAGTALKLNGWGLTETNGKSPIELQTMDAQSVDVMRCYIFLYMPPFQLVPPPHLRASLCAVNEPDKGACNGDSGGGLIDVKQNQLCGIVSWGIPCAKNKPDMYTRVFHYIDWIKTTMNNNT